MMERSSFDSQRLSQAFLVLGMHRSGTSCLTGMLEAAGLWLGDVPRHNKYNPKGNLENKSIQAVNTGILAQCGGSWDAPPSSIALDRVAGEPIRSALAGFAGKPRWLAKDPRLVLTIEAWLPHLPSHQLIGSFRHPMAVARSLHARSGMPYDRGLALWAHYNHRLLALHDKVEFPLVMFDLPPPDYINQVVAVCCQWSLTLPESLAASVYQPEAVHHGGPQGGALPREVRLLYAKLLERRFLPNTSAHPRPSLVA